MADLLHCVKTIQLPSGKAFYQGYGYYGLINYTLPSETIPSKDLIVIYDRDKTWLINGKNHFKKI